MPSVWYRRVVTLPAAWQGRRVLLHFGAVDYQATVWVNGQAVGPHQGGYTSFTFDITSALREGKNEIVVRAVDDTRNPMQPSGKQSDTYGSYGCLYTRTTGIWQTVWLEPVPETYLVKARLIPDLDDGRLEVHLWTDGAKTPFTVQAVVKAEGKTVVIAEATARGGFTTLSLAIPAVRAWSPEDPFLYDLQLNLRTGDTVVDAVSSYFGMRKVHVDGPAICLNNKPVFQRLVLDQGFYPEGIYTAPSDDALRQRHRAVHGARVQRRALAHEGLRAPLPVLGGQARLSHLGRIPQLGSRSSASPAPCCRCCRSGWKRSSATSTTPPSWGGARSTRPIRTGTWRESLRIVYRVTKATDPTRPVLDTSGYTHAGETDVEDAHDYEDDPKAFAAHHEEFAQGGLPWRNRKTDAPYRGQPFFVSEYGGMGWNPEAEGGEQAWGYSRPKTEEDFLATYKGLTEALLFHPRMCGFCYTQLTDVEQEVNGLLTYHRKPKFDPAIIHAINAQEAAVEKAD